MSWNADNTVWSPISPGAVSNPYHTLSHQGNGKWRMVPVALGDMVESDGGSEDYETGHMFILWKAGEFYKTESLENFVGNSDSKQWRWNGYAWVEGDYGARYNNDQYYPYLEFTFSGNGPQRIYVGYAGYGTGYDTNSTGANAYNESTIVSNAVAGTPYPFDGINAAIANSFYIDIPEVNPDNPASSGGGGGGGGGATSASGGARYFQSSGPIGLKDIKTFIDRDYYHPGAVAVNGYYPLYTSASAANANQSGDGSSHTHVFGSTTYYMPNGLTMGTNQFHGDLPTVSYSNISLGTVFVEAQNTSPSAAELPNGNFTAPHSMSEFYDAYIQMSSIQITSIEELLWDLVINVNAPAGSTTAASGAGSYAPGTIVNISVSFDASSEQFTNWTGGTVADSSSSSTTVTMDGDKTLTANLAQYTGPYQPPDVNGPSCHRVTMINTGMGFTSIADIQALFPTWVYWWNEGSSRLTFGGGTSGLPFGTAGELDSEGRITKWCSSNYSFNVDEDDDGPGTHTIYIVQDPLELWVTAEGKWNKGWTNSGWGNYNNPNPNGVPDLTNRIYASWTQSPHFYYQAD